MLEFIGVYMIIPSISTSNEQTFINKSSFASVHITVVERLSCAHTKS